MNLADFLRRQFAYDAWANQETLAAIKTGGGGDKRSVELMCHILAAERVWLDRLKQQPQSVPVWPEPDLARCEAEAKALGRQWFEFLDLITAGDVAQTVSYKNTKGDSYTSAIVDILTHVAMHSAYHRGQIASHMREIGQTPAYTDFIHGIREGYVQLADEATTDHGFALPQSERKT